MKFVDFIELVDAIAEDLTKQKLPIRHMKLVLKKVKGMSDEEIDRLSAKEGLKLLEEAVEELRKDADFLEMLSKTIQLSTSIFSPLQTPSQKGDTTSTG